MELLTELLETKTIKYISHKLNLAPGTVNRWKTNKKVPTSYSFDLLKLLNKKIDYSTYSSSDKDQFFTPKATAKLCYTQFCNIMKELKVDEKTYFYIEPSAGDGSFLSILPKQRTIALDIEPRHKNIQTQDYLNWLPTKNHKYIVFGNPPFGLRGNLALRFINHSAKFADFVCFILPQLFISDGKGSPRKRIKGYNLIHSEILDTKFYEPSKREVKINTIFQIWSKHHENKQYLLKKNKCDTVDVYSLSDGGTPSSTRNKKMLDKCDIYLPSTCYGKDKMKLYESFKALPQRRGFGVVFLKNKKKLKKKAKTINWADDISFKSTNSAYNLRSSQIYNVFES